MIRAELKEIPRNEVLYYLGWRGTPLDPQTETMLETGRSLLLQTARPRLSYRICPAGPDGLPEGIPFRPEGKDVRALLAGCRQVILFAATLGSEADSLLRRTQARDMAMALILNSCADAAIENVCDCFCQALEADLAPGFLTDRFSPGYGDLPFEQQRDLCAVLETEKTIGVHLSDSGMMIPQKSVTALMGLADRPPRRRFRGCGSCGMFENCSFRKEKRTCGKF